LSESAGGRPLKGFIENQDFVCFPVLESKGRGGKVLSLTPIFAIPWPWKFVRKDGNDEYRVAFRSRSDGPRPQIPTIFVKNGQY
jgi:hypothetical protein